MSKSKGQHDEDANDDRESIVIDNIENYDQCSYAQMHCFSKICIKSVSTSQPVPLSTHAAPAVQRRQSCLMNWDRRPNKRDQFGKGTRPTWREAVACSRCYTCREHQRHPVVHSLPDSTSLWHKHLIGSKSLRWEQHMLCKWFKTNTEEIWGHFESSTQQASFLI